MLSSANGWNDDYTKCDRICWNRVDIPGRPSVSHSDPTPSSSRRGNVAMLIMLALSVIAAVGFLEIQRVLRLLRESSC